MKKHTISTMHSSTVGDEIPNSLPLDIDPLEVQGIPAEQFQRTVHSAESGELTEQEFHHFKIDLRRATQKRKAATLAGKSMEAASASCREQTVMQMIFPFALSGAKSQPGRKKGGMTTAKKKQETSENTRTCVHKAASRLLRTKAPRQISGIIMEQLGLSRPTVLGHLATHSSGHWKKSKTS